MHERDVRKDERDWRTQVGMTGGRQLGQMDEHDYEKAKYRYNNNCMAT